MNSTAENGPESILRQVFLDLEDLGSMATFEKWLHPEAIWQNTGFPDAEGKPAVLDLARRFLAAVPAPYARIEILNISTVGNVVLTERVDHVLNDDKSLAHSSKIMGAFEVEDGLIKRWSDYFNPSDFPIAD